MSFLQLITPGNKLTEQDKYITVCILLKNLRCKLLHKPLKMNKIISLKTEYSTGQQVKITPNMVAVELLDNS